MSSSSGKTQTVQQSSTPWSGQQPYLTDVFSRAQQQFNAGPMQYFPNSGVVPFSNQTEQALQTAEQRATDPNSLIGGAQNQLGSTIRGDYLSGNPFFEGAFKKIADPIQARMGAAFSGAGRYGSGAHQGALASALSDTAGQLQFQNYGQERQNQLSALNFAPSLQRADTDILSQVGGTREAMAGNELQDQMNRFNFNQNAPDEALRRYMTLVGGGLYGSSTQSQQPLYSNNLLTGLGGAASAAGILGNLFGKGGSFPSAGGLGISGTIGDQQVSLPSIFGGQELDFLAKNRNVQSVVADVADKFGMPDIFDRSMAARIPTLSSILGGGFG